jgi:hypothetical protein
MLITCLLVSALAPAVRAQTAPPTVQLVAGELAGIVRDTAGTPLRDAEILLPVVGRSARTNADGRFVLSGIAPGANEAWIRHIGHMTVPFDWTAEEGKRVEIAVTLRPLPNTLDPVVVWASESKSLRSTSMVFGLVVDSAGLPVPNADLQLIGTGRVTVSGADGSFEFRHVPSGTMTLRARRMGYTPGVLTMEIQSDDQRAVTMRVRRIDQLLDTVRITEASGYGRTDAAWQEFGVRQRWRSGDAKLIGPQRFAEAGGMPLDKLLGPYLVDAGSRAPREIDPNNGGREPKVVVTPPIPDSECILENGITPRLVPLRIYSADEIDHLEYYPAAPPEREYTGTIAARMRIFPFCSSDRTGEHRAFFVLWLKSAR